MKTGKTTRSADTKRAFAALAIALARGAAAKSRDIPAETKSSQNHQEPSNIPSPTVSPKPRARKPIMPVSQQSQQQPQQPQLFDNPRLYFMRRPFFMASLVSTALLIGCTTTDPNTGERKASHTTKDAGIGAVAGAILGAATSSHRDRTKGILTGAAIGGGIGAAVGHHTDQQEAELRKKLENSGVEVQRQGDTINLVVPSAISFATNSAQLTPNFYGPLNNVATSLREYGDTTVQVVGHTDSTGSAAYNQPLSVNRANAVVVYLSAQGVATERMQAVGMGASQPIADNKTVEGRAQNRRVEIKIIPRENTQANY